MKKEWLIKTLTMVIVVLFCGAGVVSAFNVDNKSKPMSTEAEKILNELKARLDTVTTKQQALDFFKEAIFEFNKFGLLHNGMTVKSAQQLINFYFFMSEFTRRFTRNDDNTSRNSNCLVISITKHTFFRP